MRGEQQPKIMNGNAAVWQKRIGLGGVRSPLTPRLSPLQQMIQPVQPRDGQRCAGRVLHLLQQSEGLFGVRQPEIQPGKEIRVRIGLHSPRINLSAMRICARERCFGNSFSSRPRKSGSAAMRSGPASGRTVYVRPFRRRIFAAPSRSEASSTALGTRSSSRTVKVFMADKLSAFGGLVNSGEH